MVESSRCAKIVRCVGTPEGFLLFAMVHQDCAWSRYGTTTRATLCDCPRVLETQEDPL